MVASGLPVRIGKRHLTEIADMALHLVSIVEDFEIPHLPQERLLIRIGIHTGPCAAGRHYKGDHKL